MSNVTDIKYVSRIKVADEKLSDLIVALEILNQVIQHFTIDLQEPEDKESVGAIIDNVVQGLRETKEGLKDV